MADRLDCHWIATGHYAQIIRPHGADRAELHRGLDPAKDQSYVLHGIKPKVLERVLFPVGGLPKTQVREIAQEAGLPVFSKPDSVEICFVPDQDHVGLVRRLRPGQSIGGDIIDIHHWAAQRSGSGWRQTPLCPATSARPRHRCGWRKGRTANPVSHLQ